MNFKSRFYFICRGIFVFQSKSRKRLNHSFYLTIEITQHIIFFKQGFTFFLFSSCAYFLGFEYVM